MAKKTTTSLTRSFVSKPKRKRKGVHSKSGSSSNKGSRNYKKSYNGQGR
jgi:hypothetical protein